MSKSELDQLFSGKFGNWESQASPEAWMELENQLKRKKRKVIYWRLAVAASLLLLFTTTFIIWNQPVGESQPQISNTEPVIPTEEEKDIEDSIQENEPAELPEIEREESIELLAEKNSPVEKETIPEVKTQPEIIEEVLVAQQDSE